MKEYKYISCNDLVNYSNWNIVQIIPGKEADMAVISKEIKPTQTFIKLNEATNQQLIEELNRRLKGSE